VGRNTSDLLWFIGKRALFLIPIVIGVTAIAFILIRIAYPDPCIIWLGGHAKQSAIDACQATFGLNQPIVVQYFLYLKEFLAGNWGTAPGGFSVLLQIEQYFPATLELVIASMLLIVLIGIPLGVIAAQSNGRWADHLVRVFYLGGWATPTYLGALVAAFYVAPYFGLSVGEYTNSPPPFAQITHMSVLDAILAGNLPYTGDALAHLILPAAVLAVLNFGIITRMTRSSMLEVLPLDYVKSARMKGLSEFIVMYKHALRTALISTTTVLGITIAGLLSGTVVVEEIFRWPGIGLYAYDAIQGSNIPGTVAVAIVFAVGAVFANLIADILYGFLDPKVAWR
jgi:peptide/nickel transport system permease protein